MRFNDDERARFNVAIAEATMKLIEIGLHMSVGREDVFEIDDQLDSVRQRIASAGKEVTAAIERIEA